MPEVPPSANPHFLRKWRREISIARQKTIIETHEGKGLGPPRRQTIQIVAGAKIRT